MVVQSGGGNRGPRKVVRKKKGKNGYYAQKFGGGFSNRRKFNEQEQKYSKKKGVFSTHFCSYNPSENYALHVDIMVQCQPLDNVVKADDFLLDFVP